MGETVSADIIMARIKDPDVLAQNSIVMVWYPGNPADTLKSRIPDHNNGPKTTIARVEMNVCTLYRLYKGRE